MKVGTRDSELAMKQTHIFIDAMRSSSPKVEIETIPMKSSGDLDLKSPIDKLQGFGAFVRELDEALLNGSIDVSVNSMKDMPIDLPDGLCNPAVLPRADIEDVLIPCGLEDLEPGATVGTSSIRRAAILRSLRPDLNTATLRGNIKTRLSKLDKGDYDAIIMAKAGLDRLSIDRPMSVMDPETFIPAPAQGAIAIVCRSDDEETIKAVSALDDQKTRKEITVERRLMKLLGAGCSSPVGISAILKDDCISIHAITFEYSDKLIKIATEIPIDHDDSVLQDLALKLKGEIQ